MALAVEYLAMVVIGGLASPAGAVAGAVFVSCLPAVLERYASVLPGLAPAGGEGHQPGGGRQVRLRRGDRRAAAVRTRRRRRRR